MRILVINLGSSSLKFKIFQKNKELFSCHIENINQSKNNTHLSALKKAFKEIKKAEESFDLIAHRVVHGGEKYKAATKITPSVIKGIQELQRLAPLHNPINLKGIKYCKKHYPKITQIAVFDTAFYQSLPAKAYRYPIPTNLYKKHKIRRYGFHGSSHKYVISQIKKGRTISCHLGAGCSITASKNANAIDTSMGLTPLAGIPMCTRSGSIDPGIIFQLSKVGYKTPEIERMLNKESGLLALSESSPDMRDIYQKWLKKDPKATLAMEAFAYQIAKQIGAYTAALKGCDSIIFTGGIGEHAHYLRKMVCDYLQIKLSPSRNKKNSKKISAPFSKTKVYVIPTKEELQIAKESLAIL